jgi:hypothetical protein
MHRNARPVVTRLLLGFAVLVGVLQATMGQQLAAKSVLAVDCSQIKALGIDKQVNSRAATIRLGCGLDHAGSPGPASVTGEAPPSDALPAFPTNVDTITGIETYPHVTQSESMVWSSDGNTVVVNYNDSRTAPNNYSGLSVSTDGGATWTRLSPSPLASGHGTNYGEPIVVYNANLAKWFAGDLTSGCGGLGIGLWTSTDGNAWNTGACAHNGSSDDRASMWVDNTPTSSFYGRMYISWNDFNVGGGALYVTRSDDGTTWTPVQVEPTFIRNVQITGGLGGAVWLAAMDEGGGGLNNRTNYFYRSSDGGVTFGSAITVGSAFAPPGDSLCSTNSYFAKITPIWRYMGWGQPGRVNGVTHYAYAGKGANTGDSGDIYYTRSTDNGLTWSTPIVLNTDQVSGGTKAQWMPSLSVTADGDVNVYWYDRRNTTDGQNYEVWHRRSADNGATWLSDEALSSVLIPQPEQPDSNVDACYAGDYNYATAFGSGSNAVHYTTWTDGRVQISGHYQQDVFFAKIPITTTTYTLMVSKSGAGSGTVISSPAGINCGSTCNAQFNPETAVTLSATADSGSTFTGWSGGRCTGTGTCTVTMDSNINVSASFSTATYTLSVSVIGSPGGKVASSPAGIDCGSTCTANFNNGTEVTLIATPATAWGLAGWGGACGGIGNCSVTLNANASVSAAFTTLFSTVETPIVTSPTDTPALQPPIIGP